MTFSTQSPHFEAFVSPQAPDVFRSVLSTDDVWRPDPLDVPAIHHEARTAFDLVIERTTSRVAKSIDRLVLILGDAGTGKTHLLGSLRNELHESGRGFFTYMQMQSGIPNYSQYMLRNLVESLDRPMRVDFSPERALDYLGRSIVQMDPLDGGEENAIDPIAMARRLRDAKLFSVDPAFLSALIAMQTQQPSVTASAVKYLSGQALAPFERDDINGLPDRTDPVETIKSFAKVIGECFEVPLVICLDQLDDFYTADAALGAQRFQRALQDINAFIDEPNIVIVVAMLENQYDTLRPRLAQAYLDRLEFGAVPISLGATATRQAVQAVLERRLRYLYETADLDADAVPKTYPFAADVAAELAGSRLRSALARLQKARLKSVLTGSLPTVVDEKTMSVDPPIATFELAERWNDARLSYEFEVPRIDKPLMELLTFAVARMNDELPPDWKAKIATDVKGSVLERKRAGNETREYLKIANQSLAGGALSKAMPKVALEGKALSVSAVAVRTGDFPTNPKIQTTKMVGEFIASGNRCVAIGATEWSCLAAFRQFHAEHSYRADYFAWVASTKPLSSLPGLQSLLQVDETLPAIPARLAKPEQTAPAPSAPPLLETADAARTTTTQSPVASFATSIVLGRDQRGIEATIELDTLKRHAAILGGSGSGKTTLAFKLLEELATLNIPAILVDRKGDLCALADPAEWTRDADLGTAARREALRSRLDIALYTPGARAGRQLGITALPADLMNLPQDERDDAARTAALGLGAMLAYGPARKAHLAVLDRAIATLGAISTEQITIDSLATFIADHDPLLVAAIRTLKMKTLDEVSTDLSVLSINSKKLLSSGDETLDVRSLFGLDREAGSPTRISIISTKALGDGIDALFWISRLLVELASFASRRPKDALQAVVFFDEADQYLPATSKPITKEPMENLLRRARSAGLGVILATQLPGDLDYKSKANITTWLVGKITEARALEKLEDIVGSSVVTRLPQLTVGQFYLANGGQARQFKAELPVVMPTQLEEGRIIGLAKAQREAEAG